jgi:hypothetical protein
MMPSNLKPAFLMLFFACHAEESSFGLKQDTAISLKPYPKVSASEQASARHTVEQQLSQCSPFWWKKVQKEPLLLDNFLPPFPFQPMSAVPVDLRVAGLQRLDFLITPRDANGHLVADSRVTNGTFWEVTVRGTETKTKDVRWRIYPKPNTNGTFTASSPLPEITGEYEIRTRLVVVNKTAERAAATSFATFMKFVPGRKKYNDPWLEFDKQIIRSKLAWLVGMEPYLSTKLSIIPSETKGGIIPFNKRPICKGAGAKLGYNVAEYFFPWTCNYRYDPKFLRKCTERVRGKKRGCVDLVGSSLEKRIADKYPFMKHHWVTTFGKDVETKTTALLQRRACETIVYELVMHETRYSAHEYETQTVPLVERLFERLYFAKNDSRQLVFATGSYPQWNLDPKHYFQRVLTDAMDMKQFNGIMAKVR